MVRKKHDLWNFRSSCLSSDYIVKRLGVILERAMANELAALSALKKEPALAALKEGSEADQVGPAAKRVCLRHYDLSPAQLLNPMGASGVGELPLPTYWSLLCKGNKKAAAFSELCFEDPSVGMSRACDVLSQAIHQLDTDEYSAQKCTQLHLQRGGP